MPVGLHLGRGRAATVGALLVLGLGGSAVAADAPKLSAADVTFLKQASQSNRFEIATSEVAVQLQKTAPKNASARSLGQTAAMIAADHRKAQTALAALEKRFSIQVSNRPDPLQQFLVSELAGFTASTSTSFLGAGSKAGPSEGTNNGKGGNGKLKSPTTTAANTVSSVRTFYLRMQVATHQLAIAKFTAAAKTTDNPEVRKYACASLPMLDRHLSAVEKALGTAPKSATGTSQGAASLPGVCSAG
jgi:predicted outer membrane protein